PCNTLLPLPMNRSADLQIGKLIESPSSRFGNRRSTCWFMVPMCVHFRKSKYLLTPSLKAVLKHAQSRRWRVRQMI
ncbi:MAG TPA: hypothetical protein VFF11_14090, partial [Candidatus Binatia bacterium]|nr:hypothetical protein [Candidatus Binatia bacterium]